MNYESMKSLRDNMTTDVNQEQEKEQAEIQAKEQDIFEEYPETDQTTDTQNENKEIVNSEEAIKLLREQQTTLQSIMAEVVAQSAQITAIELSLQERQNHGQNDLAQPKDQLTRLFEEIIEMKNAAARQEKANIDILRDSKNFQAGVRERMQDELDQYHKLHAQNAYAPLLTEIASLYISTERFLDGITDDHMKEQLKNLLLDSIAELLEDYGVTINRTPVGQPRSLRSCKTRKTVPTTDESLSGKVAKSYNPSFMLGNQVLQKEVIDTYVYDPAFEQDSQQEGEKTEKADEVNPSVETNSADLIQAEVSENNNEDNDKEEQE